MLVFVLNQAQKANTGKIQTPVYENVREFGFLVSGDAVFAWVKKRPWDSVASGKRKRKPIFSLRHRRRR